MGRISTAGAMLALLGLTPAAAQGTASTGAQKIKALGCITCHGRDGVSKIPEAPNLAGQVQMYLATALKAYKTGERKNDMMNAMAEPLSDADIADLTAYYSAIQISVIPPPKP